MSRATRERRRPPRDRRWKARKRRASPRRNEAASRADSGAAATSRANPVFVSCPAPLSSPATTSAPAISPSSCSARSKREIALRARRVHRGSHLGEFRTRGGEIAFGALRGVAKRLTPASSNPPTTTPAPAGANGAPLAPAIRRVERRRSVTVHLWFVSNAIVRARGVFERVEGLVEVGVGGRDARDHARSRVSAEGILQQAGELGFAIRTQVLARRLLAALLATLVVRQRGDDVSQREETAVDVDGPLNRDPTAPVLDCYVGNPPDPRGGKLGARVRAPC